MTKCWANLVIWEILNNFDKFWTFKPFLPNFSHLVFFGVFCFFFSENIRIYSKQQFIRIYLKKTFIRIYSNSFVYIPKKNIHSYIFEFIRICSKQQFIRIYSNSSYIFKRKLLNSYIFEIIRIYSKKMSMFFLLWIQNGYSSYSKYRFFRFRKMLFILSKGFFTDPGRCFLRPKLSILYSKYAARTIYTYV